MTKLILRPAAVGDLERAYRWYQREREGLGEDLLREVQAAIDSALENPRMYPVVHRDTRRILVRRFPYGLYYRLIDEAVVFVACYHTRRDPKSWQRRGIR